MCANKFQVSVKFTVAIQKQEMLLKIISSHFLHINLCYKVLKKDMVLEGCKTNTFYSNSAAYLKILNRWPFRKLS